MNNLLESLLHIAQVHHITVTREILLAGLPLDNNQLTPSLIARAAQRAGLTSKIVQRDLDHLNAALFPVILLLNNNQSCVLHELDQDTVRVSYPELTDTSVEIARKKLEEEFTGNVIYVRPVEKFDARVADISQSASMLNPKGHWFWKVISEYKYLYKDVLLTALLINLFALISPFFVMNVYDRVVPNHATDTLWMLAIGMFIAMTADAALRTMRSWFVELAASRVDVTLSASIMERVLGMKFSERPQSVGSFAAGLQSFESIRNFISSATILALVDLPFVIIFLCAVLMIGWPLIFPIVFGIIIILIYTAAVQQTMHLLAEQTMQSSSQRNATLVESLNGLETVKILGMEGRMQSIWERATLVASRIGVKMRMLSNSVGTTTLWVQTAVSVVIMIVGVYQIIDGNITQGALIAVYMISSRIMAPIGQTAGLLMQYQNARTALTALENIMAKPIERPLDAQWISRPRLQGAVEFKKVIFKYPNDDREVLRELSFKINPGEHIAILGRNGSGKTTIEKIIAGLYEPSSGTVLIDGIDIRQLDPAELRRNIGYVTQDVNLFFGSLRENISMTATNASDEAVLEAVRISGLGDFVNLHPKGLAMPVGEHGQLLSGGQRQAVSIARALLNDPPILLMDEPTGAMDHTSEEEFKRNLIKFSEHKTLLIITHRTSLLELVNRIIVLDSGKIVADGPKDQVIDALRQGRIGRAG
jgi:ATP-binding cassette, subfamily C, bacterial LapB